jgi:hypothetical protein
MANLDSILWSPKARVLKYDPETVAEITRDLGHEPTGDDLRWLEANYGLEPDSVAEAVGNLLTTAGLTRITSLITGAGGAAFTNTFGFAGVGSSSTAATVGDTALGGNGNSTTAWYKGLDGSNPSTAAGVITANCTYASGDGNFAWNEWCWGIISSGTVTAANAIASVGTTPIMVNHKIQSLGTKVAGAVWTLQSTVTLS